MVVALLAPGSGALAKRISGLCRMLSIQTLLLGPAFGQPQALVAPQTVAGVEFTVRAASLAIFPPTPAGHPTARFAIAITNRGKSSIGLIVDAGVSGASTDTGLDLKNYEADVARGLRVCNDPCRTVPDYQWVVLQPNQANNVVVAFWTQFGEPQRHKKAETADLTLILVVKEGSGETTQAVLSWSDIPIRNDLR